MFNIKTKISISMVLAVIMLCISIILSSTTVKTVNSKINLESVIESDKNTNNTEMRGLWVSYITLDMTNTDMTFDSFKKKFDTIVDTAVKNKLNTLIVQVRPFCDALYKSEIFPYSHILTGTQGKDPGYDPLEYMCEAAHKFGLDIHAWINPYRVATNSTPKKLSKSNPINVNPDLEIQLDSGIYLNQAKKASRALIKKGVEEIIKNYPIDGIQFDDYFYPSDVGKADSDEYNNYKKSISNSYSPLSLEDWRFQNVNILIAEIYNTIKNINKDVVFGISPQGNIENNKTLYADIRSWSETQGYVDYICPQMYYSIDNPSLKFEDSLKEWKEFKFHSQIKVYIGLGAYKAGTDADARTWLNTDSVLASELKLIRKYSYDGFMIYDYSAFESSVAEKELGNLLSVIQ